MENIFLKYMDQRYENASNHELDHKPGPVITISRDCGCSAMAIAELLIEKINKLNNDKSKTTKWKAISKEILSMASQELKINPDKVKQLLDAGEKSFMQDIVSSFTDAYYAHSTRVKTVTEDVIRTIAVKGNVVIVGRAGCVIAANIPRALHVHIVAPLSWRISVLSMKKNISSAETKKYILHADEQREAFKDFFKHKNHESPDFDLSLNCKTLSSDQICDLIIRAAQLRNLL
jgi:cytidylate kinase